MSKDPGTQDEPVMDGATDDMSVGPTPTPDDADDDDALAP